MRLFAWVGESVTHGDRRGRELWFGRPVPQLKAGESEIELLRHAREEYTRRLLQKSPSYRLLPPALIPTCFYWCCGTGKAS